MPKTNDTATLSERAQVLFKTLVERYIEEGTPVGSRTLARNTGLDLSAATIRNVMSDLEDMGLIRSPHTSAGRVPTVQGYRLFVDSMLTVKSLRDRDVQRLYQNLNTDLDLDTLLHRTSDMLSQVTSLASIVMLPRSEHKSLRHVEFLPMDDNRVLVILVINEKEVQNRIIHTQRSYSASELEQAANYLNRIFAGREISQVRDEIVKDMGATHEEMNRMMQAVMEVTQKAISDDSGSDDYLVSGQTNLMGVSELSDVQQLKQLFEAFTGKRDILHLLDQALNAHGIQIFIGEESGYEVLDNCSVVTSTYGSDGEVLGVLGVIGPTRMAYQRVIPIVDMTARILGASLKSQE